MYGSIVWKLLLTALITAWAVTNLVPFTETPFPEYVREAATANQEELNKLMDRAEAQAAENEDVTEFMALRSIANSEEIDLHQFYPHMRLEESLRNIEKRNNLVLNELLQQSHASLQLGLDLRGGVSFTLAFAESEASELAGPERDLMLQKAMEIIRLRADGLGVSEPIIRPVGENAIEVQLPGVTTRDNPDITEALQRPALLEFRLVNREVSPVGLTEEEIPAGYELLHLEYIDPDTGESSEIPYLVKRIPEMTGDALSSANVATDQYGGFRVVMDFTSEGADRFADVTRRIAEQNTPNNVGQLAIVLDGELYSAPRVANPITGGSAEISGDFSQREAFELANVLNNPLDVPLKIAEMYEIGPSLAEDSIVSAKRAMTIGAALVVVFMLGYYLMAGIVATISLLVNVVLILGALASLGATLTLPGLAGIVLTIGMAVDANILIFERIREELHLGKSLKSALAGGYEKAFSSIVDANITTLLTAVILIYFGTGPVKGFGVTLAIGIVTSVFGALIVSRLVLELLINTGVIKKMPMLSVFKKTPDLDFMKWRKPAFIASWSVIAVGLIFTAIKGDKIYGIDFAGGNELTIAFEERLETSEIMQVAAERELGEVIPVYRSPIGGTSEELLIQTEAGQGTAVFQALLEEFPEAGLELVGETRIGPSVGEEIRFNAMLAVGAALLGCLLYVVLRFEIGYGMGAVIALVHDLLMTIGLFVLSGRQFSAPMVAGILMVLGYSINDSIIIFDRIREQLTLDPNSKLRDIINDSIGRTLSRTLLTSLTTALATGALYIFAGGVVNDFAFIFLIGIVTGTFSSIFIASPIFFWWHKGDRRHVEERKDVLPNYEWMASSKASK